MSKKRVHEIAKELKSHGIELDNKEVVTELVSLGYDVKSHSSSLEDDQATAAVQKIVDKRKPKQAAPPVAAKGFVVRRKTGPSASESMDPGQGAGLQDAGYAEPRQDEAQAYATEADERGPDIAEPAEQAAAEPEPE